MNSREKGVAARKLLALLLMGVLVVGTVGVVGSLAELGAAAGIAVRPEIIAMEPPRNAVAVDWDHDIAAMFSTDMDPATITAGTVVVHGAFTGQLTGTLTYDVPGRTAMLDPALPFKPGEVVWTSVTDGALGTGGEPLVPHVWQLSVNVSPFATASFLDEERYSTGVEPYNVALGDLDGDGDLDVSVPSEADDIVSVLLNEGDGTLAAQVAYAVGDRPTCVAVGDLNHDGSPDQAIPNNLDGTVSVLINHGDGTFAPQVVYPVGSDPWSAAIGDLNGDGVLDLVVTNGQDDSVSVLLNQGDGTLAPQVVYGAGDRPGQVQVGDLDADGDVDMVVRHIHQDALSVLLNEGDGVFGPPVMYDVGDSPRGPRLGDLDRDGDLDLAVANLEDDTVSVLMNEGDATFAPQVTYSVGHEPIGMGIGDLDGDGALDVAVANGFDDTVSVLLNEGGGTFATHADLVVGRNPYYVAMGDLDGDGALDLVINNHLEDTVSVLLNQLGPVLSVTPDRLEVEQYQGEVSTQTLTLTNDGPVPAVFDVLATELLLHFEEPEGLSALFDSSGHNCHALCEDEACPTAGLEGAVGNAVRFDGVDDWASVSDFDLPNDFSVAMWLNPDRIDDLQEFAGQYTDGGESIFGLGFYSGGYQVSIRGETHQGGTKRTGWQHLVVVGEADDADTATDVIVYRDGEVLWKHTFSAVLGKMDGRRWSIGHHWEGGNRTNLYNGMMDELMIFDRALTDKAVQMIHEHAIDVSWLSVEPPSGLVFPFSSLPLEVAFDATDQEPGVHNAVISISSNDHLTPTLEVPVTMTVLFQEPVGGLVPVTDSPTALGNVTVLTATVTAGSNVVYAWAFGDGNSGSGAEVSHIYPAVGEYSVVVTASNSVGEMSAATSVVVDEAIAGLSAVDDSPTPLGSATTLTATVTAGSNVAYAWSFGDDVIGSGAEVSHIYATVGEFTAVVTASNSVSEMSTDTVVRIEPKYMYVYLPVVTRNRESQEPE